MSLILLGILNSQAAAAGGAAAYDLLETQTLGTAAASVTFTGLGSYTDYKHLQVRFTVRDTAGGGGYASMRIRVNSDTGSNYARHGLQGNGSAVSSSAASSQAQMAFLQTIPEDGTTANSFGAGVIDILDFSSSSKNSTIRSLNGNSAYINLSSGFWNNTAALTSVELSTFGTSFIAGSRFSLYGIKGA